MPRSRDNQANAALIEATRVALRASGFAVQVDIRHLPLAAEVASLMRYITAGGAGLRG